MTLQEMIDDVCRSNDQDGVAEWIMENIFMEEKL